MKKSSWKYVVIGLILVLAIAYAFVPRPVLVELAEVRRGDLEVSVQEDGKTRVVDRFEITAPISGRLLRIPLKPGNPVKAGETRIATILPHDPELLDPRTKARAEAEVKSAKANLAKAKEELNRAEQALELAVSELKRKRGLVQNQYITQEALTAAEFQVNIREAEKRAAGQAVSVATFNYEQARAALIQAGDPGGKGGAGFALYAPIDGKVFQIFKESEGFVASGTPIMELADPNDLEVVVDLLSKDAVKVAAGADVYLEHWGGEHPIKGRVRWVEPSGFTKISALGVEEQRVNVVIDFAGPPEERQGLGDGYRVEARIVTWRGRDLLLAPTSALFRDGSDWAVFLVREGRAALTRVEIGQENGLQAEILKGLSAGDRVIVHPGDLVKEGVKIEEE